ncbi:MAG: hypothetical protein N3A38_12510 [Planctomycetota bacterium]|nr:hypothetical protein [Planctomycetota bacterium]
MSRRIDILVFAACMAAGCGGPTASGTGGGGGAPGAGGTAGGGGAGVVAVSRADAEAAELKARLRQQEHIRRLIYRLTTPGWKSAWGELISLGHLAVPHLINALDRTEDAYCTFQPDSPLRVRPLRDVCAGILEELVTYHSDYRGELPKPTKEDWAIWWAENGERVAFNR